MRLSRVVFALAMALGAVGQAHAADWVLDVVKSGQKITAVNWKSPNATVPAVPEEFVRGLTKTPEIKTSLESELAVLVVPPRGALGLLYGDTILLKPGQTSPAKGLGFSPEELAIAPEGFFFTREVGNRFTVNFYHASKPTPQAVEVLVEKNAAQIYSGAVSVELSSFGAVVQDGTNVVTYQPNGFKARGAYVFTDLTAGNVDVIEGQFGGVDLVKLAKNGGVRPGAYDAETLNRIVNTFFQKQQRNPLVWGPAGLDPTGVVNALAHEMAAGKIAALKDWRLFQMDWTQFDTGGEVDVTVNKVRTLLTHAKLKKVILFFPDIDQLIGLGVDGNDTTNDASSAMISELSLGRVVVLGTSTAENIGRVRKHIPFYQTFREIQLKSPSGESLYSIVRAHADRVSKEYKVVFADRMVEAVIELTTRHLPEEAQPGKSIDAITDLAVAYGPPNPDDPKTQPVTITNLMVRKWLAEKTRIPGLNPSEALRKFLDKESFISALDEFMVGHRRSKDAIHRAMLNVIGGGISSDGSAAETGVQLLLFTGPSGVGKSFSPQILSRMLREKLGIDWKVKTWEGEQFKDEAAVNVMFGAPPGYVGYNERGGPLYRWVRDNPQSIMVFEEMDKMHRSIHDALYKVFDDGVVIDNSIAKEAHFTRGLIFLTSNFGAIPESKLRVGNDEISTNPRANDFIDDWDRWHIFGVEPRNKDVKNWTEDQLKVQVLSKLRNSGAVSPQMIGRIGTENIVLFHHFKKDEIRQIGVNTLKAITSEFEKRDIKLEFDNAVMDWAVERAWGEDGVTAFDTGARSILNVIKFQIAPKITSFALGEGYDPGRIDIVTWRVGLGDVVDESGKATGEKTVVVKAVKK